MRHEAEGRQRLNWVLESSIRNLTRAIRKAGEGGDVEALDELSVELNVLVTILKNAKHEAAVRRGPGGN